MARESDLAESLRVSFARLNRALKIEGVRDRNHPYARLNVPDLVALDLIGRQETCIMSDGAQELGSPMSTVTSVVDRLVKGGLVSRERDVKDKRSIRLVPTKVGRKLLETLGEEQRRNCEVVLAALKPKERDIFVSLIAKVASAIEADAFKAK
jgi:DNA-binding MarR family transcriptional regulator